VVGFGFKLDPEELTAENTEGTESEWITVNQRVFVRASAFRSLCSESCDANIALCLDF